MMYDWANSAHSVIVVTILPIFFDTVAGYTADSVSSMSTWGFATSLAMAIVAPQRTVFGRVRRYPRNAQKLFLVFLLLGIASVGDWPSPRLWTSPPRPKLRAGSRRWSWCSTSQSTIGFDASCIYYDAF